MIWRRSWRSLVAASVAAVLVLVGTVPALAATTGSVNEPQRSQPQPRTTVEEVSRGVMCPTCETTLDNSNSPAAERMRVYVSELVAQGLTREEVESELVAAYDGDTSILASPEARGAGLGAWFVPAIVALLLAFSGAVSLRRWRRSAAAHKDQSSPTS